MVVRCFPTELGACKSGFFGKWMVLDLRPQLRNLIPMPPIVGLAILVLVILCLKSRRQLLELQPPGASAS